MIRAIIIFITLCAGILQSAAQRKPQRFELMLGGGGSYYSGDLVKNTFNVPYYMRVLSYSGGVGLRVHFNNRIAFRGMYQFTNLKGADSLNVDPLRRTRNLSFRTRVNEASIVAEISVINWKHIYHKNIATVRDGHHNLYLFGGISLFQFNPQGWYQGEWYDLQPLGTEGQGVKPGFEKYSLTSHAYIFGLGYRYKLDRNWSIGAEFSFHRTNTDYLDDLSGTYYDNKAIEETHGVVAARLADRRRDANGNPLPPRESGAQRGDPKQKDYFSLFQVTIHYKLGKTKVDIWKIKQPSKKFNNKCWNWK